MKSWPLKSTYLPHRERWPVVGLFVAGLAVIGFFLPRPLWIFEIALGLPLVGLILSGHFVALRRTQHDAVTGLVQREAIIEALELALSQNARRHRSTGALILEVDRFKLIEERHDRLTVELILKTIATRLTANLRKTDVPSRLEGAIFAVALSPERRPDLESAIQLSTSLQHALAEPIAVDGENIYLTVSVGFSLAKRSNESDGATLLQSATSAMIEAQRFGPGAVRSYSDAMHRRIVERSDLSETVSKAMDEGQIRAFYQPQVSTKTGKITGFETLARWQHPERGLIPPIEFLPALAQAGLMGRLGEIMVRDALATLTRWDKRGFGIQKIGVNFSNEELRDPCLSERISWELDKHDLRTDRLSIEVLETVVASRANDVVIRNLSELAKLGCSIDLDDFGTGHASITSIRKYSIERIKIDRSFITGIDEDPEQQKMVTAILTMAERLGLDTLAEGVETSAERRMLAKLGCGHIQGFGIARPLPPEEVDAWIQAYQNPTSEVIPLTRRSAS